MAAFDIDGVFWVPTSPESHVAGRLRFNAIDGGKLDLIGTLSKTKDILNDANVPKVLHGIAGSYKYTLRGCQRTNFSISMPGIERETYNVREILRGVHLNSETDFEFIAFRMKARHLSRWIGTTGISYAWGENPRDNYLISYDRPPAESEVTEFGTIEICYGWETSGDNFSTAGIDQSTLVKVVFGTCRSLEDVCSIVSAIQDIITLGMDATAITTNLWLEHEQHTRELPGGTILHEDIELFQPSLGADIPESKMLSRSDDILVTFDDIGRIAGLSRWLYIYDKFRVTIRSLLSHRYMPQMYGENRLQNAVFAAESFDRTRFENRILSREEFRLRKDRILKSVADLQDHSWVSDLLQYSNERRLMDRLLRLAKHAGDRFHNLVEDVEGWANLVKNTRNRLVHRDGSDDTIDSLRLYLLSESVYFLVVICLLRECGIKDAILEKEFENRRYVQLRKMLRENLQY